MQTGPAKIGAVELAMDPERLLLVVANADFARFFEQRGPAAPLVESPSLRVLVDDLAGPGEAPLQGDLIDDIFMIEGRRRAFFFHVAQSIDRAARECDASRLALFAPPAVLCSIRDGLGRETRRLLACELAVDLAGRSLEEIETNLREHCGSIDA